MSEFCFECPVCKRSVYVTDSCAIRDHAIEHIGSCKPHEIIIFEVANGGEILSQSFFYSKKLDKPN